MQIILDLHSPQQAIVTDCISVEQIAVFNPDGVESSCGFWSNIEEHIAPTGELNLSVGDNLSDLSGFIEARGFLVGEFSWVAANAGDRLRPRDIPDLYCGCRLFYPDSLGASQ